MLIGILKVILFLITFSLSPIKITVYQYRQPTIGFCIESIQSPANFESTIKQKTITIN